MGVPALIAIAALVVIALAVWAGLVAVHHLLTWLVIGLIAGALAGRLVRGSGLGCLLDIVVGLAGAIIGGLIIHQLDPSLIAAGGLVGVLEDVVVAFLGAVILLCVVLLVTPHRGRRRTGGPRLTGR
jgi:uncharacterized membrane protein YeaQ/YmgE (transglycosylase-associated protein family)